MAEKEQEKQRASVHLSFLNGIAFQKPEVHNKQTEILLSSHSDLESATSSKSSASAHIHPRRPGKKDLWSSRLRLLHVSSIKEDRCIYQYKWSWPEEGQAEGIHSLIQSFLQLARELDTGDVECVNFQLPSNEPQSPFKSEVHGISSSPTSSLQMLCVQEDTVVGALFYEPKAINKKDHRAISLLKDITTEVKYHYDEQKVDIINLEDVELDFQDITDKLALFEENQNAVERSK